jgi:hypothetical protein
MLVKQGDSTFATCSLLGQQYLKGNVCSLHFFIVLLRCFSLPRISYAWNGVEAGIESQALEARSGVVVAGGSRAGRAAARGGSRRGRGGPYSGWAGGSRRRAVIRRLADAVLHPPRRRKGPSNAWRVALLG